MTTGTSILHYLPTTTLQKLAFGPITTIAQSETVVSAGKEYTLTIRNKPRLHPEVLKWLN